MLHGYDMAVRAELHIERALCTVKHRIPLDLGQILHGLSAVGADGIFRVLHPVGKAANGVHIVAGSAVKQGHRCFGQHKRIFGECLIVLWPDIAFYPLRPVKELRGKDLHAAVQGKAVEGGAFQEAHAVGTAGGCQNIVKVTEIIFRLLKMKLKIMQLLMG